MAFDVQKKTGLVLISVLPGSPADRAGMRAGDIVLAVNGVAVNTYDDYLSAAAEGVRSSDVLRAGRLIEFTLEAPK